MRKILFLLSLLVLPALSFAQNYSVQFPSGSFVPAVKQRADLKNELAQLTEGNYYCFIQFYQTPTEQEKKQLQQLGVQLFDYVPNNTYSASIPYPVNASIYDNKLIRSIFDVNALYKMNAHLAKRKYPEWAMKSKNEIEVVIIHQPDISNEDAAALLAESGVEVTHTIKDLGAHRAVVKTADITRIASLYFVSFVDPFDANPTPDNLVGRTDHRGNMIATAYATGMKYDGTGVVVGLNDDGVIGPHIDYKGRLMNTFMSFNSGNHGDHCAGTIMGAGNRNPTTTGMAFGSMLNVYGVSGTYPTGYQAFDSITNHYANLGERITSTSYSAGNLGYSSLARTLDIQIRSMPELMHVFSSGNNGTSGGGYGYPTGWGNVTGGHKMGKNLITVGNVNYQDVLEGSSSRGPAHDGRIKPDICAVGRDVNSTVDANTYALKTGTSMACPGVSGILAQLYHAYKDLHAGANPLSGLIKALVLNTADDIGNPGPDYRHGWGRINARRAFAVMQANQYMIDSITQGVTKTHTITVPANTAEVRVMVYWPDYQAVANATRALVNNLNMTLTPPSAAPVLPWVLNPASNATTLNQNAVRAVDTLNNMEQVTIAAPVAGTYTVTVNGFNVPQGPQKYFVVYEFVTNAITVTYPSGGESIVPGSQETIRWDAYGSTGTFTVQYSTNNGGTWNNISTTVPATQRYFNWTPPAVVTGQALVRVTRGANTDQSDAMFSIIGVPANMVVDWVCVDSFKVSYSAVNGAAGYVVSMLGAMYMDSVGTSTTTSCVVRGVNTLNGGWFSVHAIAANNCKGRRAYAQTFPAAPFNCFISNDIGMTQHTAPTEKTVIDCFGAPFTEPVSVTIVNNGSNAMSNITFKYSLDGATPVSELYAGPLAPAASYTHNFATPMNFATPGNHIIKVWVEHPNDATHGNDTLTWIKQVVQPPIFFLPFSQDFETFTLCDTAANCGQEVCTLGDGWINEKNSVDDDMDWRVNFGPTPTQDLNASTGPTMDFKPGTATGQYLYMEADNCFTQQANLVSPCINLISLLNAKMKFAYHMFGAGMGELHVDVFNGNWVNDVVPAVTGDQGNSWKTLEVPLFGFVGKLINIRFRGITGGTYQSDIALDDISFINMTGIEETGDGLKAHLFPNPSKDIFNLELINVDGPLEIVITSANGQLVQRGTIMPDKGRVSTKLDLGDAASGIYFLTLKSANGAVNKKLIKL